MNIIITQLLGDPYITLDCQSSECLHYSQVPGYTRPSVGDGFSPFFLVVTIGGGVGLIILLFYSLWSQKRNDAAFSFEETEPLNPNASLFSQCL